MTWEFDRYTCARMVGIAQLVERCVVVADVAGSSPVTHPKWVRCELATKGPPLVAVRAWPIFGSSDFSGVGFWDGERRCGSL